MKRIIFLFGIVSFIFILTSCHSDGSKKNNEKEPAKKEHTQDQGNNIFGETSKSVFTIKTFDGTRILETGRCFVVADKILVAPFSFFAGANRAEITPFQGGKTLHIKSFLSYNRIDNLILIYCDSLDSKPLNFYKGDLKSSLKTFIVAKLTGNTIPIFEGKFLEDQVVQGERLFRISNKVETVNFGMPIFLSNGEVLGLATAFEVASQRTSFAIPTFQISKLLEKASVPIILTDLLQDRVSNYKKIKAIVLETDYGNISIKLYNETPAYRDNFIALAREGYYDSLLIHRIIREFGIQTGAADTRNALHDDVVGWKGPGYTIPAHIVNGLYHKRGAIGSPRKPDTKNAKRRSDGSQFYIITGRVYDDDELNEFEQKNNIKFTAEQRQVYKTIGGAPHLDGAYTVFGEVISGIEVADKMVNVPTQNDYRPLNDIRLKRVKIVE